MLSVFLWIENHCYVKGEKYSNPFYTILEEHTIVSAKVQLESHQFIEAPLG